MSEINWVPLQTLEDLHKVCEGMLPPDELPKALCRPDGTEQLLAVKNWPEGKNGRFTTDLIFQFRTAKGDTVEFRMRGNVNGAGSVAVAVDQDGKVLVQKAWRPTQGEYVWEVARGFKVPTEGLLPDGLDTALAKAEEKSGVGRSQCRPVNLGRIRENTGTHMGEGPHYWLLLVDAAGVDTENRKWLSIKEAIRLVGDSHSIVALTKARDYLEDNGA